MSSLHYLFIITTLVIIGAIISLSILPETGVPLLFVIIFGISSIFSINTKNEHISKAFSKIDILISEYFSNIENESDLKNIEKDLEFITNQVEEVKLDAINIKKIPNSKTKYLNFTLKIGSKVYDKVDYNYILKVEQDKVIVENTQKKE